MPDTVFLCNAALRAQLAALLREHDQPGASGISNVESRTREEILGNYTGPLDIVVTLNEINDRHGTGPLVKRLFRGRRNILSIRSRDDWGYQDFADWRVTLSQQGKSRPECFRSVLSLLSGRDVRSVLCVPFLSDELLTSIAIKEAFEAKLCAYLMDDQNVAAEVIPNQLMQEFLEKASLRLATHPELRLAYEHKFGLPFYLLPAIVPARLVATETADSASGVSPKTGALLGSFWDQEWFDRLCSVLAGCHSTIHWYGNDRSPWLKFPPEDLARAGIQARGLVSEERLAVELRKYPYVIVPAGALEGEENNKGVASLSLPGRILFALATSHTPILVVGSRHTCAARFVRHFGVGETVPYQTAAVAAAMERLSKAEEQQRLRSNAARIARTFSDDGIVEWLRASIDRGEPADPRFEEAFRDYC